MMEPSTRCGRERRASLSLRLLAAGALLSTLAALSGCGGGKDHPGIGGGGSSTTTGPGGGGGGQGGATSSSSASSASSSDASSSSSSGAGGAGGTGGGTSCNPVTGTSDYPAEHEPNNSAATANTLGSGKKGFTGSLCPFGDLDLFAIDVVDGGSLRAALSDGMGGCSAPHKFEMRILDGALQPILTAPTKSNGCPAIDPAAQTAVASLSAGTYYVELHNVGITEIDYVLDVSTAAPACGDGIVQVQLGEQCDDGNLTAGDGCSGSCVLEAGTYLDETEPNDTQATANSVDGFAGAVGSISPTGDVDFYAFTVTVPGSSVRAAISDGLGGCPPGNAAVLHLLDPAGTQLAQATGGGPGGCPLITPAQKPAAANLAVGTYAIEVTTPGGNPQSSYVVDVHVAPPGCGDSLLETGEQCDDGNTTDGDGCSATCQTETDMGSKDGGCCSTGGNPASSALLGLGVVGLVIRRRRRT
jgi:MYXO-CTERM domain-containing protein